MDETAVLPQVGAVVGGKYRVQAAIGMGGMGAVYRAEHLVTQRPVALKWLRPARALEPGAVQRFLREARAAARVRHPNVVDVYDVGEQDGRAFLVFELLEGESLRSLLRRRRLPVGECLALLVPAMRGVAAAHAEGVIHRDLKPDNLFITRDPDHPERSLLKVLDFGISKVAADTPEAAGTLTATGATLGTPHYMSLEQLQGAEVDARSDVYALGVVLFECLTGQRPFEADSFAAIVVKVATEAPADPLALCPHLPAALGAVVLKAMAKAPADRYPTVPSLIDALAPFADLRDAVQPGAPVPNASTNAPDAGVPTETARRAAPRPGGPRWASARAAWLAIAVASAVAVAGLAGLDGGLGFGRSDAGAEQNAKPSVEQPPSAAGRTAAAEAPTAVRATPRSSARAMDVAPSATALPSTPARFDEGWVYLGEYDGDAWVTRYFEGWQAGLPAVGDRIRARGRSNVRVAMPDRLGSLARVHTIIGPSDPVEVLGVLRWQGTGWVWARVRSV